MKKVILSIIVLFLLLLSLFLIPLFKKSDNIEDKYQPGYGNWEKVTDYIYLEKDSIKKDKYSISGWFKIFNSDEYKIYDVDNIPVYYKLGKYEVFPMSPVLCPTHNKFYDRDGILLSDKPDDNPHNICPDYIAWTDGEIIYKALLKYKNDGE